MATEQGSDGYKELEYTFVIPKDTDTLYNWGKVLNHCIAGFRSRGNYMLLAVLVGNKLRYTLDIRDGRISQFYGNSNSLPEEHHGLDVRRILGEKGITNVRLFQKES